MELSHLRYFVHVARSRSFVAGAALSHVTAPAMSKVIRKLEDELGEALFVRTTRSVALTEAGEVLLRRARMVLEQADAIAPDLAARSGAVGGELRVASMEVFSIDLLPRAVAALVREHPTVTPRLYEMHPQRMARHLADGDIDVAFTVGAPPAGVTRRVLGDSRALLVCGRGHPLYERGRASRADLQRHPSVVPRLFQLEHLPSLDQFPEGVAPRAVGATIELLQSGVTLVVEGCYLGYFPEVSVRSHLRDGSLRRLAGLPPGAPFELAALTREGGPPRAAAARLIEHVARLATADRSRPRADRAGRRGPRAA